MEDRWGTPPSAEDSLALVLIGCIVAVVVLGRGATVAPTATESSPTTMVVSPDEPGSGMALFAALLEAGSYPPAIRKGDTVLVVVTPPSSSDSVTRALPDRATVTDVSEASTITGGVVVSMLGPDSMPREIADAERVHLSIVDGGK